MVVVYHVYSTENILIYYCKTQYEHRFLSPSLITSMKMKNVYNPSCITHVHFNSNYYVIIHEQSTGNENEVSAFTIDFDF